MSAIKVVHIMYWDVTMWICFVWVSQCGHRAEWLWAAQGADWWLVAGETLVQVQQRLSPEQQHYPSLASPVPWCSEPTIPLCSESTEVSVTFEILICISRKPLKRPWQDISHHTRRHPAAAPRACWQQHQVMNRLNKSPNSVVMLSQTWGWCLASDKMTSPIITLVTLPRHCPVTEDWYWTIISECWPIITECSGICPHYPGLFTLYKWSECGQVSINNCQIKLSSPDEQTSVKNQSRVCPRPRSISLRSILIWERGWAE